MFDEILILLLPGIPIVYEPMNLLWILILSCFAAFFVGFGIGANDVANAFGTSVGSGAISLPVAIGLASVMEFLGAVTLGQQVVKTIKGDIANVSCFEGPGSEAELMLGMMCTLMSVGFWLIMASHYGLPVSTTHSVVGGIIGFTIVSKGFECVNWGFNGMLGIVLSWLISPILTGALASIFYLMITFFILKTPYPKNRSFQAIPFIFPSVVIIAISMVLLKSPLTAKLAQWIIWLIIGILGVIAFLCSFFFGRQFVTKILSWKASRAAQALEEQQAEDKQSMISNDNENGTILESRHEIIHDRSSSEEILIHIDEDKEYGTSHEEKKESFIRDDNLVNQDRDDSIKLDSQFDGEHNEEHEFMFLEEQEATNIFSIYQPVTASFLSFAHGANDTANSIGPFAAIFFLYTTNTSTVSQDTPIWMMAVGAFCIVLGLATFGRKVLETIGTGITPVNFIRGFCVEISTAFSVVIASMLGFPVSTTHCAVGGVVCIGFCSTLLKMTKYAPLERKTTQTVDLSVVLNIVISWLVTVPIAAIGTAALFGFFVRFLIKDFKPFPYNCTDLTNCTFPDFPETQE